MYDAPTNENYYEFIEIHNLSDIDSVDLSGWKISDGNDFDDILQINNGIKIAPKQYAVILDPGYFENDPIYNAIIPPDALVLTISGSTFGSGGLSNSTAEKVTLLNASLDTISTYRYSLGNAEGYSDEKIVLEGPNTSSNWSNSKFIYGTPGSMNSVRPIEYDIEVSVSHTPRFPSVSESVTLLGKASNIGTKTAAEMTMTFFYDQDGNSILDAGERIGSPAMIFDEIIPGDSLIRELDWQPPGSGSHSIVCQVEYARDENVTNNTAQSFVAVAYERMDLVINEIMYSPLSSKAEWIEIFNPTEKAIDLNSWKFSDSRTGNKVTILDIPYLLSSDSYIILAEDNSIFDNFAAIPCTTLLYDGRFPALNDTYDSVILYDFTERVIDQVDYQNIWGKENGVSLERSHPLNESNDASNWGLNQTHNGGTPGGKNSTSPLNADLSITANDIYFTPPYAITVDTLVTITAIVHNIGLTPVPNFQVHFYHDKNRDSTAQTEEHVGSVLHINEMFFPGDSLFSEQPWNDYDRGQNTILVKIEFSDDENLLNNSALRQFNASYPENVIVINEIMYSPFSGQPEWVELYNRTESPVNLINWKVSDSVTEEKIQICSHDFEIQPDAFVVIAADTLAGELFPDISSTILYPKNFPSLKNDGDDIYLYDINDKVIDVIQYRASWGGGSGISLERINPDVSSLDNANWGSCVRIEGGTPGSKNSIFIRKLPATASISASPDPFSPDFDGIDDVVIVDYQLPAKTATINMKIYDMRGRLVRFLLNNRPAGATGSVIWDGIDDDGHICRIGIYIIYLEALNAEQGMIVSHKKTVVLAAKL